MDSGRILFGWILSSLCFLSGGAWAQVVTEFSLFPSLVSPSGITAGPDGNLWFTDQSVSRIGRITPLGVVTVFEVGITAGAFPVDITTGPDGSLWFTEYNGNRIGRITPSGVVTEFSDGISALAYPWGIAAGPDGNLWFTESQGANRIGRITPSGVVTEFSVGISAGAQPIGITAGPDGNLWFAEASGNRIGRITPLGVVTEFSAGITAGAVPVDITTGPDGNLWFTEELGNRIGRITPLGVVTEFSAGITNDAHPRGITLGPDGNLWFTELRDRIGRITPLGVVTEFSAGITASALPLGITAGPDGNLWFAEGSGSRIGRITHPLQRPCLWSSITTRASIIISSRRLQRKSRCSTLTRLHSKNGRGPDFPSMRTRTSAHRRARSPSAGSSMTTSHPRVRISMRHTNSAAKKRSPSSRIGPWKTTRFSTRWCLTPRPAPVQLGPFRYIACSTTAWAERRTTASLRAWPNARI